jgi:hypothetical protein
MQVSALSVCELLSPAFSCVGGRLICDKRDAFLLENFDELTPQILEQVMYHMLFALPQELPWGTVAILPNPVNRFCIDLREQRGKDNSPTKWMRSKKFRKYIGDFDIVVKTDLRSDLALAKRYHECRTGGTWITAELIELLQAVSHGGRDVVQCFSFSLVSKSSAVPAAVCLGFACGGVYQDYTMCTPVRDTRSCGSLLSRTVGCILQQMGVSLWYWGYRMPYMDQYSAYGARDFSREEFNDLLRQLRCTRLLPLEAVALPHNITLHIQ